MSTSLLPNPTAETLAYLRRAITVARRKEAGERPTRVARELGLTRMRFDLLRRLGDRYLAVSPCIRRLMEACPHNATGILNFVDYYIDMGSQGDYPSRNFEAACLVARTRAKVLSAWPPIKPDSGIDTDAFYRAHREQWCRQQRGMGVGKARSFLAWVDECETGLRAPQALDGLPSA